MSSACTRFLSRSELGWLRWASAVALGVLCLSPRSAVGYVPAQASNSTDNRNTTDGKLSLKWWDGGSDSEQVLYPLAGADSTGMSQGVLVHFSEDEMSNGNTTTPWIALVSCDANSTHSSTDHDIFTLAKDRGAIAALLYSLKFDTCDINPEYSDPAKFDQVMDVFVTQSLHVSMLIDTLFNKSNQYYWFNATMLNNSGNFVESVLAGHAIPERSFVFATLTSSNATDAPANTTGTDSTSTNSNGGNSPSGGGTNTSLAMIILYAITGCVSALFCVVIVSGAIRAIRHPERYGPRSGDAPGPPGTGAQSRARGLTRAILDTFPVVKFDRAELPAGPVPAKDIESVDHEYAADLPPPSAHGAGKAAEGAHRGEDVSLELREWPAAASRLGAGAGTGAGDGAGAEGNPGADAEGPGSVSVQAPTLPHASPAPVEAAEGNANRPPRAGSSSAGPQGAVVPRPPKATARTDAPGAGGDKDKDVVPDAIGRETCPICIVDFEEGDDLRILPCEGHHRFHQECVDQWLLELSSSCPLCRQDFQALQTMMAAGEEADHLEYAQTQGSSRPMSSAAARFSRYLRTARGRRQRRALRDDEGGYDPTNPPVSLVARTTLNM